MSTTRPPHSDSAWRAVVAVRVPPTDGSDLATSARQRLERSDTVTSATVDGVRGLEPTMSATVVTVVVRIETTDGPDSELVREALGSAPGTQRVESVEAA